MQVLYSQLFLFFRFDVCNLLCFLEHRNWQRAEFLRHRYLCLLNQCRQARQLFLLWNSWEQLLLHFVFYFRVEMLHSTKIESLIMSNQFAGYYKQLNVLTPSFYKYFPTYSVSFLWVTKIIIGGLVDFRRLRSFPYLPL